MKSTFVLPLISPLLVSAQTASLGSGPGPSTDASLYLSANQNPNATGQAFLSGANITNTPFTLSPISWTIQINVTEVAQPENTNQTITNSVISLSAPPDGGNVSDSLWESCVMVLTHVERNATVDGQDGDAWGSCEPALGAACVGNLTSALGLARARATSLNNTGGSACGGMSFPAIPEECEGRLSVDLISSNLTYNDTIGNAYLYQSSDPHDSANLSFYDEAVTRIWPVILIQSPNANFSGGAGFTGAQMACLRANESRPGSREVTSVPGSGVRLQTSWVWGLSFVVMGVVGWGL